MRASSLVALVALVAPAAATADALDEIVARHVAARGGRQALAAVRTLRMNGRTTAGPGRDALVVREIARPGRIRTEFTFQGTTGVYAYDGARGWRVSPLDGVFQPEPMPAEEAAVAAEQADIDGPLVDWKAKGHALALVGRETLPGGPADHLKLTLKSSAVRQLWLDAASGLVVRSQSARRFRGREVVLELDFGDYRKTDNVAFARSIEAGEPGHPQRLRIVVENVVVNVPLDPSRFQMPR